MIPTPAPETAAQRFLRTGRIDASPYEPAKLRRCPACGGSGRVIVRDEAAPVVRLGNGSFAQDWPANPIPTQTQEDGQ